MGRVLRWAQQPNEGEFVRDSGAVLGFGGRYQLKDNPYKFIRIAPSAGGWSARVGNGVLLSLVAIDGDSLSGQFGDYAMGFRFVRDSSGRVSGLRLREGGILDFDRVEASSAWMPDRGFYPGKRADRADSLRGMLTSLRSCYDVLFYDLGVRVDPDQQAIQGRLTMRFKVLQLLDSLQVDLFANMDIDSIVYHGRLLPYRRWYNAVIVSFEELLRTGSVDSVSIMYHGTPQVPDWGLLKGGWIWFRDKEGHPWIESVSQGSGASLWWPCKDHLSDKPDSMRISVTVPGGLREISNGRLLDTVALPDHQTRYDWYVDYPINNYDVVVNIGNYVSFSELFGSLRLRYYYLPYDATKAARIFSLVKPMLALYERDFGPYPFPADGFSIMESLYPMEHQGAVSIGPINNPILSDQTDYEDLKRVVWHESAHEWWGNSVTCSDMADLWIHEAFANYAEELAYAAAGSRGDSASWGDQASGCDSASGGDSAGLHFLSTQVPENKVPIIGTYGVNDFHLGDMYSKGAWMLHTLRHCINNDSLWFALLRGIQSHFRYQSISTDDLVVYINGSLRAWGFSGYDWTSFFDQYLRHASPPVLDLRFRSSGHTLFVSYRWKVETRDFNMPVKVTFSKGHYGWLKPTTEWQEMSLVNMRPVDFSVDTDDFYVWVGYSQ
jgi:aminopeptidase N